MPRPLTPALVPPDDIWHKVLGGLFSLVEHAENFARRKPVARASERPPIGARLCIPVEDQAVNG